MVSSIQFKYCVKSVLLCELPKRKKWTFGHMVMNDYVTDCIVPKPFRIHEPFICIRCIRRKFNSCELDLVNFISRQLDNSSHYRAVSSSQFFLFRLLMLRPSYSCFHLVALSQKKIWSFKRNQVRKFKRKVFLFAKIVHQERNSSRHRDSKLTRWACNKTRNVTLIHGATTDVILRREVNIK